jgi:hypothetical protein
MGFRELLRRFAGRRRSAEPPTHVEIKVDRAKLDQARKAMADGPSSRDLLDSLLERMRGRPGGRSEGG